MATKVDEAEVTLHAPDPIPVVAPEKAAGLVPLEVGQVSQLEAKADAFVNELAVLDPNSPEFGKKVDQLTILKTRARYTLKQERAEAAGT